jgi:hypothetical protein
MIAKTYSVFQERLIARTDRNSKYARPEQSRRFIEAARKAEAAETKEEADRAFRAAAASKKRK